MLLSINTKTPEPRLVNQVVDVIKNGGIIIYPTDTVYGLGCSIYNKKAMQRLYQIKKMNLKKPLTFVCSNQTQIQEYSSGIPTHVFKFLRRKLPGPYTFVFKASKIVPKMMLTPRKTVGLRWPDYPIANRITSSLGHPILSSSLRISEDELFDNPYDIHEKYKKKVDLIVDGGSIFAENSTIIDFSNKEAKITRVGKGSIEWLDWS